jgi:hypothetical protein
MHVKSDICACAAAIEAAGSPASAKSVQSVAPRMRMPSITTARSQSTCSRVPSAVARSSSVRSSAGYVCP